ncbi:DNA-directed DNA polymerase [Tanacetum coccineum]
MSFMTGTLLDPFQIPPPERKLTMEEIINKFIDEGRREHDEMEAFIREFKTTNKLLLKERNNSLSELGFELYGLTRAFEKAYSVNCEIKGVTTRGGKTTIETTQDFNMTNKPPKPCHDEPLNIPFTEALAQMPKFTKFLKNLLSNKTRLEEACTVTMNERCSVVLLNNLPLKEKDPRSFTIPCDIGNLRIDNALADLEASISLMPYSMYENLGLGEPKPSRMSLELADRSIQYPRGIAENAMIDVINKKITLRIGEEEVIFNVDQSIKKPVTEDDECYGIDDLDQTIHSEAQELMENDHTDSFLIKDLDVSQIDSKEREQPNSEKTIRRIQFLDTAYPGSQKTQDFEKTSNEYLYSASANEINENIPELKDIPSHLEYAYLNEDRACPVIVSSKLTKKEKASLLQVFEKHKGAIA